MKENLEPRTLRKSCRVVCANIRGLHKNESDLSLIASSVLCVFFEFMVSDFGKLMQLLKGDVDLFRGLGVYVRDNFSIYRQPNYECGCCEVVGSRN